MYLSKIEIFGFKSFADRTEFRLRPGLTGIVGPNGCGKSNVVDALKWVLGEQSAKSLRGTEMLDVIFNGAGTRKPLGLAEVSLTFSECGDVLRTDYETVTITRRLYRSGESEYLMNKQPCRLKDIKELFMDTGIGKTAYSVIEQGRIDALLQANAGQRRAIFEEAAGISRYKAKRKETERRLERVEQNLQRLSDITEEVEKQIRTTKAQASRARRYREVLEEWKTGRLALAGARRRTLRADADRVEERLAALREQEAVAGARLSKLETDLTGAEEELSGLQESLLEVRGRVAQVDSSIEAEQDRSRMERERGEQLADQAERLGKEAHHHRERIREIVTELHEKREASRSVAVELEKVEEAIQSGAVQEATLVRELQDLRAGEEDRKSRLIEALNRRAQAQNRKVGAESSLTALEQRLDRMRGETAKLGAERETLQEQRSQAESTQRRASTEVRQRRDVLEAQTHQRQRLEVQERERGQRISEVERQKESVASRLEVLQDLRSQMTGVEEGVKSLLSVNGNGGFPGLGKMLADSLDVDLRYAKALEAALGVRAQAIVAEGTEHAVDAIRFLKREERGRASVVPLDHIPRNGWQPPLQGVGLVGPAASVVRAPEPLRELVGQLLGHTWIVQDLETALRFSRNGGTGETFVTLDGDLIDPAGFITGGRGEKTGGLIVNRSQVRVLEESRLRHEVELASLRGLLGETATQLAGVRKRIEIEQRAIEIAEGALGDAGGEVRRLDHALGVVEERLQLGRLEIDELQAEKTSLEQELVEMTALVERTEAEAQALEREAAESAERRERVRHRREEVGSRLNGLRVTEARIREKREAMAAATSELGRSLSERRASRTEARRGASTALVRSAEALVAAEEAGLRLTELIEEQEVLQIQAVRVAESRDEKAGAIQALREETREAHEESDRIGREIQEVRLQENQTQLRMEQLQSQAQEEFGCTVDDLHEPEDEWNEEEERERIAELKQKLDRMGNVNLEALDQLAELEERHAFLEAQRDDLERAKRSLQEVMRRIAKTCKERFAETFEAVRGQFQEVFRKLFGGGRADIFMEEGAEDELEAGVEIVARPPGKEPRHISLLSGGEKTLTTIALLFAIFKSRPSPFCILDEVDAALDESNINRFVMLLREFLSHSQFLIITHSKPTMAVADDLYGVTQEEQGVSKRIAVRFEEIERQVA